MVTKKVLDWKAVEEKARGMSNNELHYALVDIQKTLPFADARDRANGTDEGGYYRDEASVYRREQARRAKTCIVVEGKDGPTLWDCDCPECRHLQLNAPL